MGSSWAGKTVLDASSFACGAIECTDDFDHVSLKLRH